MERSTPGRRPKTLPHDLFDLSRMADEPESTDVLGSYTGMAENGEPPVQDADDL